MKDNKCYIGEIGTNSKGTKMEIVGVRCKSDIDVKFLDEHQYIKEHTTYQLFTVGTIKNPFDPTIYNVGYIGVGKQVPSINRVHTRMYKVWSAMIRRCYDYKSEHIYHSYYNRCTVCDEWKNMQNFGDWYDDNYIECEGRLHLDKDILHPGNKIYSPDTCLLIPQSLNSLFINVPNKTGLPNGVRKISSGRFSSSYSGKQIGIFDTIEEAYVAHTKEKKKDIIKHMEEIRDILPEKVINAIYNYEFKIENDENYLRNAS